jgi:hypothetical protein
MMQNIGRTGMTARRSGVAILLGALLAAAGSPANAASAEPPAADPCAAPRLDNPGATRCLLSELDRLAPLLDSYTQAARNGLQAGIENAVQEGWGAEARGYREALVQFDVAQAKWVEFSEAHCRMTGSQITGSGAEAAPYRCRMRLVQDRLLEVWHSAYTGLPDPRGIIGPIRSQGPHVPQRWPEADLARFVFEHLDLSTFSNSTAPRRRGDQRSFAELGIKPVRVTATEAAADDGEWLYSVRILRAAENIPGGRNVLLVCFRDAALGRGSYDVTDHLVLQLIEGRAVALALRDEARAQAAGCGSGNR